MTQRQLVTEKMRQDWAPVLDNKDEYKSKALSRRDIMTRLLENQSQWCNENRRFLGEAAAPGNSTGAVATWSPVLISMVKRSTPNLIALDFMGTQPLGTPDGLIFAMRARYNNQTGDEAFYQDIKSGHSGDGTVDAGDPSGFTKALVDQFTGGTSGADPAYGKGMTTAEMETLGTTGGKVWGKMAVTVEKQSVSAKGRGLYADYSHELRQDMAAVHGEDVDAILSDMLVNEIQAEMNREFIRTLNVSSKLGFGGAGIFDLMTDTDGRWLVERLKGLMFRIELEANAIAIDTRRGKGNRLLCSANVASALAMAGMLDFTPAMAANAGLDVDATGQTFAGVLANGMKVFIDPYAVLDYINIVYKGESELDAGIFYAPYTPLEMYRGLGEDSMNPRLAFKTRYGVVANPFYAQKADGTKPTGLGLGQGENGYGRKLLIKGITA
ncbi:gp23 major head protein [Delftia phage PhiW-14]|uniref:Gp23 major head protein n=1 Tax=Delftia phage PhiW-14 TaxID=665032 RepID=C9DG10_BPW14|nr:gp23 major head protein [Delftia phage PhiW-14]ACV50061.1 gp23 major head protein [Delftia phage PhiW-14]